MQSYQAFAQTTSSVCSALILFHSGESRINAHVRKLTFKLPDMQSHPIIMVAAGTGIAPLIRAFLQQRARLSRMGREIGRTRHVLFFGCRDSSRQKVTFIIEMSFTSRVAEYSRAQAERHCCLLSTGIRREVICARSCSGTCRRSLQSCGRQGGQGTSRKYLARNCKPGRVGLKVS